MKRILFSLLTGILFSTSVALWVTANDLVAVPEGSSSADAVWAELQNEGGNLWDAYDDAAYNNPEIAGEDNLANQIRTWIMTWDTLIFYLVFLLQLLSQVWLLIWVLMVIFVWYQYAAYSITWSEPQPWNITKAIAGIAVIIFSYAILNLIQNFFL